ncbi:alpha-ribazole phosphatase [Denitratisoma sp. agr-D3]
MAEGVCYGRSDLPLDPAAGSAAALAILVQQLRARVPSHVACYASPLQRCRVLAEALHPRPRFDARLQEMDFGAWEMRAWEAIPRAALDDWAAEPLDFAPPGGESVARMRGRVLAFLREQREAEALLLVTHGGVMKILAGMAADEPVETWLGRRFAYGELLSLTLDPERLGGDGDGLWQNAGHD